MPPYLFLSHPVWTALFWFSFIAFFAMGSWSGNREKDMARGESRDRGSRMVIYLTSFAGIALAFAVPNLAPFARITLSPTAVFAAAMTMLWSGIALYILAVRTLGTSFRTSVTLLEGQRLVTRGPYRILRHPAYTGGILIFAGIGLAIGNWLSLAVATLSVAIGYARRIQVEEAALRERFRAEFEAHEARTWAVIPFVW